jgi:hypothetical protein
MSERMLLSDTLPVSTSPPGEAPSALRVLGLVAVCIGVAALAAGTFVLSYSGIHAIALQAGISPRLARGYPLLLDAMLVVVLAALLSLRGAGVPSKILAWLTLLALLAAAAGADALHAAKDKLPATAAEITAAVLPWVLVFLAFVLLLAMLRHAHQRRLGIAQAAAASEFLPGFYALPGQAGSAEPARSAPEALTVPRQRRSDSAVDSEVGVSAMQLGAVRPDQDDQAIDAELAIGAQVAPDDPVSDETALEPGQPDPVQPDPVQPEPVLAEPEQPEPVLAEPEQPEPEQPEPVQPEPVLAEPVQREPVLAEPEQPEPVLAETGQPEPVLAETGQPEPVLAETGQPEPELVESPDPDMPVFHRITSSPVPPGEM